MSREYLLLILISISSFAVCSEQKQNTVPDKVLDNYTTYSLAQCIKNNYISMGVDFNASNLTDTTTGFIDIEEGFGFSANKDNPLDSYIKRKTQNFYKPKQTDGDLAKVNLVIYDCATFSQSKELNTVLRKLIIKEDSKPE